MSRTGYIALSILITVAGVVGVVWILRLWLRHTKEDPRLLIRKWMQTAVVLGIGGCVVWGMPATLAAAFIVPITGAACGVVLTMIWGRMICEALAAPLMGLLTGGSTPPDREPFYSIALAKLKARKYPEALQEVNRQLEQFPEDFKGQMLWAELHADGLHDLPAAEAKIMEICDQEGRTHPQIAGALSQLADWHLKLNNDLDSARHAFELIIQRFPDTSFSQLALQRLAHLGTNEAWAAAHDRTPIPLPVGVDNVGLLEHSAHLRPAPEDPEAMARDYVRHLAEHPHDNEVRENLARVYGDHYGRLDLVMRELEELVQEPNQPPKMVERWSHLMADYQILLGHDVAAATAALQRLIDRFPDHASAQVARGRIGRLQLELKGKEKSHVVQLGTYEQNIGLKMTQRRPLGSLGSLEPLD